MKQKSNSRISSQSLISTRSSRQVGVQLFPIRCISVLSTLFKINIFVCVFVSQAYGEGSSADCRRHVQKLNLLQGQLSEVSPR